MADNTWIDEALKNTRFAHRFFLGFAVTVTAYFLSNSAVSPARWTKELARLEAHWSSVQEAIDKEVASHGIEPDQVCVRVDGRAELLADWNHRWRTNSPRVAWVQSLDSVQILRPARPAEGATIVEVDCEGGRAWSVESPFVWVQPSMCVVEPERSESALVAEPLWFGTDGLTVMNAHAEYGKIRDAGLDDVLEIIEIETTRRTTGFDAGLPVITTASLRVVALALIAFMLHLIVHLSRLREMAESGDDRRRRVLGFPWIVTMNSFTARFAIDVITVLLALCPIVTGALDQIYATVPYDDTYRSPGILDFTIVCVASGVAIVLVGFQISLQVAVGLDQRFYEQRSTRRPIGGTVPVRVKRFIGRAAELNKLESGQKDYLVLSGEPEVGKTELALEFARIHQANYPGGTFVIDCEGGAAVGLAEVGRLALKLSSEDEASVEARARTTLYELASLNCLLIYDGITAPDELEAWLPSFGHVSHVIVTTTAPRSRWRSDFYSVEEIEPLGSAEISAIFESLDLPAAAASIVRDELDGMPGPTRERVEFWKQVMQDLEWAPSPTKVAVVKAATSESCVAKEELVELFRADEKITEDEIDNAVSFCDRIGLLGTVRDPVAVVVVESMTALVQSTNKTLRRLEAAQN